VVGPHLSHARHSAPRSLGMLLKSTQEPQIARFGVQRPHACDLVSAMRSLSLVTKFWHSRCRRTLLFRGWYLVDVTLKQAEASAHVARCCTTTDAFTSSSADNQMLRYASICKCPRKTNFGMSTNFKVPKRVVVGAMNGSCSIRRFVRSRDA
jgi:hypothetical protein